MQISESSYWNQKTYLLHSLMSFQSTISWIQNIKHKKYYQEKFMTELWNADIQRRNLSLVFLPHQSFCKRALTKTFDVVKSCASI